MIDTTANGDGNDSITLTSANAANSGFLALQNFQIKTGTGADQVNVNGPLAASGNIAISTVALNVAAGGSIASSGGNLNLTTVNSGNITLTGAGSASTTETGTVTMLAAGNITTGAGGISAGSGLVSLSAASGITAATSVSSLTAANTTSGNISLSNPGTFSVTGITQSGSGNVSVSSTGSNTALTVNGGVTGSGGSVTLQATGNLIVAANQTINGGSGPLTLAADLTAAGAGDDGIGTLTINAGALVKGANIKLRGADEDILSTALVGTTTATTQVTIQSSVESRPMQIGGNNNAAVAGVNLTSAELARIVTTSTGTITIGDSSQTGNITFTTATPATTAGASTVVMQSASGVGQIILDDGAGSGTALSGNGGALTLTAGTGGIVEAGTNHSGTADLGNASTVALTSAGAVGASGQDVQIASTSLTSNTAANNSNQFLSETGTAQLAHTNALNTGSGTIKLDGGTFQITTGAAGNAIADASPLTVNSPAILDLHGNSETIDTLNGSGSVIDSATAATLTVTGGGTFSGVISGANTALTVAGLAQSLTLSGVNTYSGATTINAGTLAVGINNALSSSTSVTINLGTTALSTLALAGYSDTVGQVHLLDGSITGTGTLTSGTTFDVQKGSASAILAGAVGLTKTTANTVTLSGVNTYTGASTISAGTLSISADANLGGAPVSATAGQLVINGGTLLATAGFTLNSNRGIALGRPRAALPAQSTLPAAIRSPTAGM